MHALDRLPCFALDQADHGGDLGGGTAGARRQLPYFIGHHGKAATLFTGARGFDGGVEGEQVGLIGDRADGVDDGGDLLGAVAQLRDQR